MAKSSTPMSQRDSLTRTCAKHFGVSKKSLKKAIEEATVRRIAEKIAEECFEASWQDINGQSGQAKVEKAVEKPRQRQRR